MCYEVMDTEWNRNNYRDLIGKTFRVPPAYARVIYDPSRMPQYQDAANFGERYNLEEARETLKDSMNEWFMQFPVDQKFTDEDLKGFIFS